MAELLKSKFSPPKFYSTPQGKVAVIGDTVRLQCSISGCPSPNATWSRYNVPISSTNRIDIREQDDLRILEISKVTPEDEGLYKVIVENDYGHCDATVRLDVIKK